MNQWLVITVLVAATALGVVGDFALKNAAIGGPWARWWMAAGVAVYAATAFGWVFVLKHMKLAMLGAMYSATIIIASVALGTLHFHEKLTGREVVGVVLALGAVLVMAPWAKGAGA